jgi:hypothetical protein
MYQSLSLRKDREHCQKTMKERKYLVGHILAMEKKSFLVSMSLSSRKEFNTGVAFL